MDISDPQQVERLIKAVETNYKALEPFRKCNEKLIKAYAGAGYGHNDGRESLLNLTNQVVDAYVMALAANRPRVMVTTEDQTKLYFARHYELAVNALIEEIGLEYTLRQAVMDAFFCVGIVKCHMADAGPVQIEQDLWMDPGKPFASNVNIDNFVFDTTAKKWSQVKFAGDVYRVTMRQIKQMGFNEEVLSLIHPTSKYHADQDKLAHISTGSEVDADELEPSVDLIDLWLPCHQVILTFAVKDVRTMQLFRTPPLASMPWTGSEKGPYHLLGFNDVPENIMPTPPALQLEPLNRLINNIMRKQRKRADAQKQVHFYTPAGADDADRAKHGSDDAFIRGDTSSPITTVKIGGVDNLLAQFRLELMGDYDRMAGNLTAMLGLGAQADTASQEQLIHGAVSKKEAQMQFRVIDMSTRLVSDLGRMLWEDQFKTIQGRLPIEGTKYSVDATWTPQDREGAFEDYKFEIDMFSLPYRNPSAVMQAVNGVIDRLTMLGPLLQQQGGQINVQRLVDLYAEMLHVPQLRQVVDFVAPDPAQQASSEPGHDQSLVPNTTRNYVRRSVSAGPTAQARNMQAQQAWAQAGETAA